MRCVTAEGSAYGRCRNGRRGSLSLLVTSVKSRPSPKRTGKGQQRAVRRRKGKRTTVLYPRKQSHALEILDVVPLHWYPKLDVALFLRASSATRGGEVTTGSGEASRLLAALVKEWYTVYVPPLAWVTVLHLPRCQIYTPIIYPGYSRSRRCRHAIAFAETATLRRATG